MQNPLTETTSALSQKISTISDQLRVQAHLASMEAKDSWESVSQNLQNALQRVNNATSKIGELTQEGKYQAELALMEAKDGWQALKGHVETAVADGVEAKDKLVRETQSTLIHEGQALLERLEEGVKSLSERIKH